MRTLLVIGLLLFSWGCSTEIEFPIDQPNPRKLVIDGFFMTLPGANHISLHYTTSYKSGDIPEPVVGATVLVEHNGGVEHLSSTSTAGVYNPSSGFQLEPGEAYSFVVITDQEYRYRTVIEPLPTVLDGFFDVENDTVELSLELSRGEAGTGYYMAEVFSGRVDPLSLDTVWDVVLAGIDESRIEIITFSGNETETLDFGLPESAVSGDSLFLIRLHAFNEELFEYVTALRQDLDGDLFGQQPSNPKALFSNQAIGAVFNSATQLIRVELED